LWGEYSTKTQDPLYFAKFKENGWAVPSKHHMSRRKKMESDIQKCLAMPFLEPFITYIFGEDNFKQLTDMKLDCRLIHKSPYVFEEYRHKLECLKYAMEEFDEVVFLDWDTKPSKQLPADFWEQLNKKSTIQSSLWSYKTPMINHRQGKENKHVPSGAFIYIRDKTIPEKLIKYWETRYPFYSEQPPMALLTDEMTGGWKGTQTYFDLFEPVAYHSVRSPWRNNMAIMKAESVCFVNKGSPTVF